MDKAVMAGRNFLVIFEFFCNKSSTNCNNKLSMFYISSAKCKNNMGTFYDGSVKCEKTPEISMILLFSQGGQTFILMKFSPNRVKSSNPIWANQFVVVYEEVQLSAAKCKWSQVQVQLKCHQMQVQSSATQCSQVQCSAVKCDAVQSSASPITSAVQSKVQSSASHVQSSASAVKCNCSQMHVMWESSQVHCSAVMCNAVQSRASSIKC